jgi:hypothetical protein
MPLTLLIPDLIPPADAPEVMRALRLPALEAWIARARTSVEVAGTDEWLASEWGIASPVPHAAIALVGDAGPRDGLWLHADPVHLQAGRDTVTLYEAAVLEIVREEADALVAALDAHFRRDGFEFVAAVPKRWYLRIEDETPPESTPLEQVRGRELFGRMPRGGSRNWPGAMTEAQMVLSSHAVNQRREAQGKPTINGVWFWGAGRAPESVAPRFASVISNDAFARGLARLSGAALSPAPLSAMEFAAVAFRDEESLVQLDILRAATRVGDVDGWVSAARALDDTWFADLGAKIAQCGSLRIVLPGETRTTVALLDSRAKWRWFARRQPISKHA